MRCCLNSLIDSLLKAPVSRTCRALPAVHLEVVLERIAAAIAADPSSRTAFVQSGALKAVEELGTQPACTLALCVCAAGKGGAGGAVVGWLWE